MKDIRSLLLVLLSTGLVATWVYHFYDKANYTQTRKEVAEWDKVAGADNVRDSLQQQYSTRLKEMDAQLGATRSAADSLQVALSGRIAEINQLRAEIAAVLKNPTASAAELRDAKKKMDELQRRVDELRTQNQDLEAEKLALTQQLSKVNTDVTTLEQNMRKVDQENQDLREKIKQASVFQASALHFTTMNVRSDKERETAQSRQADKFIASFNIQNNLQAFQNAELYIVITEPDGHVLQSSSWDSGSFDTKTKGKINFTRRMKFDYEKGELKTLIFSLDADNAKKGKYTLQVWHQGSLIGEAFKVLH